MLIIAQVVVHHDALFCGIQNMTLDYQPSDLNDLQWQRLLVSALDRILRTTDLGIDLEYAQWLVNEWRKYH